MISYEAYQMTPLQVRVKVFTLKDRRDPQGGARGQVGNQESSRLSFLTTECVWIKTQDTD